MNKIQNQHGDLLLEKIDSLPVGCKEVEAKNGFILERGEGVHTHVLEDVGGIKVYEKDGETYVSVDKKTHLNHEEHGVQFIEPGVYKKRIERVFDYESMEARKVID